MNNTTLQIKFKQRLNKLASEDYDNIQCWEIVESFNKAQIEWCRRQLRGSNLFKDGDEMSKRRVDDLQVLLKTQGLAGEDVVYNSEFGYFRASNFNDIYYDDYLEYKKIETRAAQVIAGPCAEEAIEAVPPIPGTPFIPGTDPTAPIYGPPPLITPGTDPITGEWIPGNEGPNVHNDMRCSFGWYQNTPITQQAGGIVSDCEDWDISCLALEAYTSGDYTMEELALLYPVTECNYQIEYFCDGTMTNPWDDEDFCNCLSSWAQFMDPNGDPEQVGCEYFWYATNSAFMNFQTGQEYSPFPSVANEGCIEIENSGPNCDGEETEGYWECPDGTVTEGEETDDPPVCVEGTEPVYGEPPILVPGTPGTPPIPATPGTPGIPGTPAISGDPLCAPNAKEPFCREERSLTCYLTEVANVDVVLRDPLKNPNFDWSETIVTLQDNEIRIWRKDFFVVDPKLIYYRKPVMIECAGCIDPYTNQESPDDIECEFKDDIVELMIDEAVSIIAGDISDVNQFARGSQSAEKNN